MALVLKLQNRVFQGLHHYCPGEQQNCEQEAGREAFGTGEQGADTG